MTEWTAKAVEHRVLEAAETLMLCPNHHVGGSAWIDVVRSQEDAYGYGSARYRRLPSPSALSRMTETWGWINAHPVESERKLLYAWAWQKTKKGRFLSDFAAREGVNSRTLRRCITAICHAIATRLNQQKIAWPHDRVDALSEIEPEIAPSKVASQSHAGHMMAEGSKPHSLPDHPDTEALIRRMERANRKRAKTRKVA